MIKFLLLFLPCTLMAQESQKIAELKDSYSFKHLTCHLRANLDELEFKEEVMEELKERKFEIHKFVEDKRLFVDEMYLDIKIERLDKKLFKDCMVDLKIKKAQNNRPSEDDPELYSKKIIRSFPRVTFSGDERCTRAISDAFVHVPTCKKATP